MRNKFIIVLMLVLLVSLFSMSANMFSTDSRNNENTEILAPLTAPTIALNNNVLSWEVVDNATLYTIYNGDVELVSTTLTRINLSTYLDINGTYSITVVASGVDVSDSVRSNSLNYVVALTLPSPIVLLSDSQLTWQAVPNATSYLIYNGSSLLETITLTTIDLSTLVTLEGTHLITVIASASGYTNSLSSNSVSYVVSSDVRIQCLVKFDSTSGDASWATKFVSEIASFGVGCVQVLETDNTYTDLPATVLRSSFSAIVSTTSQSVTYQGKNCYFNWTKIIEALNADSTLTIATNWPGDRITGYILFAKGDGYKLRDGEQYSYGSTYGFASYAGAYEEYYWTERGDN